MNGQVTAVAEADGHVLSLDTLRPELGHFSVVGGC